MSRLFTPLDKDFTEKEDRSLFAKFVEGGRTEESQRGLPHGVLYGQFQTYM